MSSPLLFAIASMIWGSTFWAITLQLGEVPPAVSVAYRFGISACVLFALCALRGDRLRLPWRAQGWMMLQGSLTFGLSYVCTYGSEQYLVLALVAVLFALMVFWTPICNRILFGADRLAHLGCRHGGDCRRRPAVLPLDRRRVAGNRRGWQRSFPASAWDWRWRPPSPVRSAA